MAKHASSQTFTYHREIRSILPGLIRQEQHQGKTLNQSGPDEDHCYSQAPEAPTRKAADQNSIKTSARYVYRNHCLTTVDYY